MLSRYNWCVVEVDGFWYILFRRLAIDWSEIGIFYGRGKICVASLAVNMIFSFELGNSFYACHITLWRCLDECTFFYSDGGVEIARLFHGIAETIINNTSALKFSMSAKNWSFLKQGFTG